MLPLDILVVAPHPDDAEISVGGTMAVSLQQNLRVGVVELTSGEPTPHGSIETRRRETQKSTEILGLTWRRKSRSSEPQPAADTRRAPETGGSLQNRSTADHPGTILAGCPSGSCGCKQSL